LCILVKDKNAVSAFADYKPSDSDKAAAPAAAPPKPAPEPPKAVATPPPPPPPPQAAPTPAQTQAAPRPEGGRVFATPLARKLAAERNIDLSLVEGSGPDKQIRAQDVSNFVVSAPAAKQPQPSAQKQDFEDLTINNYRSVTAKRLLQSKQTIPHYYLTVELEIDQALK
jgi:pyruvate dehydrogenase E2 component (dihydrolipoamide acetyltransferase)